MVSYQLSLGAVIVLLTCRALPLLGQSTPASLAKAQRPVTVQDLVRWRQFQQEIMLSPDGKHVAYVLREPNVAKNINELVLYVVRLPESGRPVVRGRGRELLRTEGYGHFLPSIEARWLASGDGLLVLHQPAGEPRPMLSRVDLATGRDTVIYRSDLYVKAFAANARGDRLVVTGNVPSLRGLDRFRTRRGLLIGPDESGLSPRASAEFEARLYPENTGTPELRVVAIGGPSITLGRFVATSPTMSPDGRYLTFSATARDAGLQRGSTNPSVVALVTVPETLTPLPANGDTSGLLVPWPTRMAFDDSAAIMVRWSTDGATYVVQAPGPTPIDKPKTGRLSPPYWAVDVASGAISRIIGEAVSVQMYRWDMRGLVGLDAKATRAAVWYPTGELVVMRRPDGKDRTAPWTEERRVKTEPLLMRDSPSRATSNGRVFVGVKQSTSVPPDLYMLDIPTGRHTLLTEINPEVRNQLLGKTELVEWEDSVGSYFGHIIYPPGYVAGTRYPCAILAKSWDKSSFIYEDQDGYRAGNFPARALAGADIMVFMLGNYRPKGSERWEVPNGSVAHHSYFGARRLLANRGLIDPARCGIQGFSHTAFEVPFLVTHPGEDPSWAVAVDVDGGLGNYVAHFMGHTARYLRSDLLDAIPAGARASATLDSGRATLLARSPAWNAEAARTPVLQHYHGDRPWGGLELYKNLWARGKPVELWWYIDAAHTLRLPSERESSMQRMVDWYRFWLQGIERPDVQDDPERYVRWRALRAQHLRNEQWIREGKDPAVEFVKQLDRSP